MEIVIFKSSRQKEDCMQIGRRQFLKYCVGSAAALGLPLTVVAKLESALAADGVGLPTVIWLNGANCTGCTVSLANHLSQQAPTDIADLLVNHIDLAFHPNLMGAAGDLAIQTLNQAVNNAYVLAIDGGIPTAFDGHACMLWTENGHEVSAKEAVIRLAADAAAILSIGTCASFGGIPAGNPNPTNILSVSELIGRQTINIPGCPTHPDWILWTVASLLAGVIPELDERGRPREFFREEIHKKCPRKGTGEAKIFGKEGVCLKELGCKGPSTKADCHLRQWNNATNWCIGANAVCLGCTERGFPDEFSPFYKIEYEYRDQQPVDDNTSLRIIRAEFRSNSSELSVDGDGSSGSMVFVENAEAAVLLGSVPVDAYGKWRFRLINPDPVPGRVRAKCGDEFAESGVITVNPGDDDDEHNEFEIKKCEWRADKRELKVDGEAENGALVTILNANTAIKLGTARADSEGKWKFRRKRPRPVPCRVRTLCDGYEAEKDVMNAPAQCV
jgi:hydrogenase small subunit